MPSATASSNSPVRSIRKKRSPTLSMPTKTAPPRWRKFALITRSAGVRRSSSSPTCSQNLCPPFDTSLNNSLTLLSSHDSKTPPLHPAAALCRRCLCVANPCAGRPYADWFKKIDRNGDGKVSHEEMPKIFDQIDADKDGVGTIAELTRISPRPRAKAQRKGRSQVHHHLLQPQQPQAQRIRTNRRLAVLCRRASRNAP